MVIKEKWQVPLFILLFIFSLLISTQYKTQLAFVNSLSSQSKEDLVALVKSLNEKRKQLEIEADNLIEIKRSLDEKAVKGTSLISSLENERKHLEVIAGMVPVHGQGITTTISGDSNLEYHDIIDLLNELWVSGAEIVAINDTRIEVSTIISQREDADHKLVITINNKPLLSPVIIKALGDPDTLKKGLTFPGGIVDNFNTIYKVYPVIKKEEDIMIPACLKYLK